MWVGVPDRGAGRDQPGGWVYNILPFLDQGPLHDLGMPGTDAATIEDGCQTRLQTPLDMLHCPTRRRVMAYPAVEDQARSPYPLKDASLTCERVARTDYAINGGDYYDATDFTTGSEIQGPQGFSDVSSFSWPDTRDYTGISYMRSEIQSAHIRDGQSVVYLLGEKYLDPENYETGTDPGDDATAFTGASLDVIRWANNGDMVPLRERRGVPHPHHFGSAHSAGCNFVFCDGSVHLISFSIDPETNKRLGNRKDGKPVDASLF